MEKNQLDTVLEVNHLNVSYPIKKEFFNMDFSWKSLFKKDKNSFTIMQTKNRKFYCVNENKVKIKCYYKITILISIIKYHIFKYFNL